MSSTSTIRKIKNIEKQLEQSKALHKELDILYEKLLKLDKKAIKDNFKNKTVVFKTAHFRRYSLK